MPKGRIMTGPSNNHPGTQVGAPLPPASLPTPAIAHGRHEAKVKNLRDIIEYLRTDHADKNEIAILLGCGESCARAYFKLLESSGIVKRFSRGQYEAQRYYLIDDAARIEKFFTAVALKKPTPAPRLRRTALDKAMRDETRHFHLLQDDTHFAVKIAKAPLGSDPKALPLDFFRSKPAAGEPLPRTPSAPRAPAPSFPDPADFRLALEVAL